MAKCTRCSDGYTEGIPGQGSEECSLCGGTGYIESPKKAKANKKSEEPPETQTISIPLYCRCTICGQEEKVLLCEEKLYTDSHNWDNGTERPPETTIQVWQCFPEKTVCYCNNKRFELVVKFPKEK